MLPRTRVRRVFQVREIGTDLYLFIFLVQLFLAVFMFFFFTFMEQTSNVGFQQTFKYNQFSGAMVIGLIMHTFVMVVERKITLIGPENKHK